MGVHGSCAGAAGAAEGEPKGCAFIWLMVGRGAGACCASWNGLATYAGVGPGCAGVCLPGTVNKSRGDKHITYKRF